MLTRPVSPRWAVGLWALALAAGLWVVVHARYVADLSAFLPASPDPQQRVLVEQVKQGAAARVLMIGIEGGTADSRAEASQALATGLRRSERFTSVSNGAREAWASAGTWLVAHRYALSDAVTPERFTVDGLREAFHGTLSVLGTPAGEGAKALFPRDPTGEVQHIAEGLLPAQAPRLEQGVWVSREVPRAVLLATMKAGAADMDGQAAAIGEVRQAFESLPTRGQGAQALRLVLSGPGVFALDSRAQIQKEATQLAIVGSIGMAGLLLAAFGRVRAVALAALPVATGVVAGIAAVALAFGSVHGLTLGFGSTLIGEAVDYAIYYLIQARAHPGRTAGDSGAGRWLREGWPTVRLGLLTSVCGFAALVFSGFPGLAQLGVFSIAGLVAAALSTRYVLTAIAPGGSPGTGLRRLLGVAVARLVAVAPRLRPAFIALALAAVAWLVVSPGAVWRGNLMSLSPVSPEAQAVDAALRGDLGASDARTLVVASGATVDEALQAAEAAAVQLDTLVERGDLGGYDTPARLLPSAATQARRLAALPDATTLGARLPEAARGLPFTAERLREFVQEVDAARSQPAVTRESLRGTALEPVVDALLLPREGGGWSALLPLQTGDRSAAAPAIRAALAGVPRVDVVDMKQSLDDLYAHYMREARWQSALGAVAVLLLLAWHVRKPRRVLALAVPLVLAGVITLALVHAGGAPLGILHLVGLLLVVAVGSNYALFFDYLRHESAEVDTDTLASLLLANVTTVVSFGLIAGSDIAALNAIGVVVAPGALLALLLSAAFIAAPSRPV